MSGGWVSPPSRPTTPRRCGSWPRTGRSPWRTSRRTPATAPSPSLWTTSTPWVDAIAARGIEPTTRETYGNGVRKVTFHDPDGNEIGFGGAPV